MSEITGNSKYVKKINRMAVLNIIKENEFVSRQKLAEITGLTPPTITGIVRELVAKGFVKEEGLGKSSGGRKPVRLKFNRLAGFVIGVEVTCQEVVVGVADLMNKPMQMQKFAQDMSDPQVAVAFLAEKIKGLSDFAEVSKKRFLGVGVAFPGLLLSSEGVIKRSINLGRKWDDFPFKAVMEEKLGMAVCIENNSNASVLAERWFGGAIGCCDLAYINLGEGISAGIILDDRIVHGFRGHAGEIGHIVILEEGPLCNCGNRGCLESICSIPAIIRKVNEEMPLLKKNDSLKELWQYRGNVNIEDIIESCDVEGSYAHQMVCQLGRYIGIGISSLINLYNPEMVFIGGRLAEAGKILLPSLLKAVQTHTFPEIACTTDIKISKLGADSGTIGACALILKELLKPANSTLLQEFDDASGSKFIMGH